jgi:mannose/cellobiose epimerase-like protein (N-acyl-D-glucosamine 2-epimerase family)
MLYAMLLWYQYTGDPAWKQRIDRLVDGMDRILIVHKDDWP